MLNGKLLRRLRETKKVSQTELAKAVGVSKATISRYESGERTNASARIVLEIADFLEVDPENLEDISIEFDDPNALPTSQNPAWVSFKRNGETIVSFLADTSSEDDLLDVYIDYIIQDYRGDLEDLILDEDTEKAQIRITTALMELNKLGQQEAVKRVEELTEIPRYTKRDDPNDDQT